ncbi:MAG: hypothetical protein Q7S75_01320 [bacterium]|nr:hypothetical protein [bacterium]
MYKYVIGAVLVILVIAIGNYVLSRQSTKEGEQAAQTTQTTQPTTNNYSTSTFSVSYPSNFTADDSYAYDQISPKKLIHGVKFTIPGSMATGTNLSAYDTGVSVEELPRAQHCTGDIYLLADAKAFTLNENGVEYSVATSSGVAAGNLYEETVYALATSSPCTAVRYFIHSANIGNYEPGAVREFDPQILLNVFNRIRQSLVLKPTYN